MKLLITGGCGFLGSNLASHALKIGWELLIFDNLHRDGSIQNLLRLKQEGNFTFVHGDIRSQNDVDEVVKGFKPDAVFHLAGQVAMTTSISNPRLDFQVNVVGTFNLLEAVRRYQASATVIYSSTNKVYGDLEQYTYHETDTRYICNEKPKGFDEMTPISFHSPYGCSKGSADQYMLDYYRIFNINTVVFRHSSMYGGGQFATYDQGWIGWFCQKALEAKKGLAEPFTISGNGKQVRDVLYCDDIVELYYKTAENIEKAKGQEFNIGGGSENSLSLLELFTLLEKELDVNLRYSKLVPRESDQKVFIADIKKIQNLIGWQPKIDKEAGIVKMISWVEKINGI